MTMELHIILKFFLQQVVSDSFYLEILHFAVAFWSQ
jgi:hypothetical protein